MTVQDEFYFCKAQSVAQAIAQDDEPYALVVKQSREADIVRTRGVGSLCERKHYNVSSDWR